jgi:hypothetical protein
MNKNLISQIFINVILILLNIHIGVTRDNNINGRISSSTTRFQVTPGLMRLVETFVLINIAFGKT